MTVSSAQLLDATGASYRQIDHWTVKGYITPDNRTPGSGRQRVFPDSELPVVAHMVALTAAGMTPAAASRVARALLEHGEAILTQHHKVVLR